MKSHMEAVRFGLKSLIKNSSEKKNDIKAEALLCPTCCVEYVEVEFDFEVDGTILQNIKALQCPSCEQEVFTPQQMEEIRKRISS